MSKLFRTITSKMDAPANAVVPSTNYTRIFIRDLQTEMLVGIYDHEKKSAQPVVVNLEADVAAPQNWRDDTYEQVVCYETIVNAIRKIAASGHINLLETLAAHIADFCMQDSRIQSVTIRVEKTAVFADARSAGVEIRRGR